MSDTVGVRHLLVAALTLALVGCGGHKKAATPTVAGACASVSAPAGAVRTEPKPRTSLDAAKTYDVTIQTNCGSFTIRLAVKTSPATTASFVSLVRRKFFDGTHGVVAMAKGATEAAGTAGSQFFVMTASSGLPADYAVLGRVARGLGVVDRIGKLGDANEQPTETVEIEHATVAVH